ncbi:DUF4397 domain-containing protein [Paraburkholderia xenovorans]|uniref:DUF4397 domain-containing protein n=1 Tax=Paraburkholderia xenovorans TaxID=36873 RepID=UPI0038B9F4E3
MLKTAFKCVALPVALIATAISLAACGGGGNKNDLGDRLGISNPSVRFVNAAPNTSLSLYRNGSNNGLNENNVAYSGITKFSDFDANLSTFSVRNSSNVEVGTAGSINGATAHRYLTVALPNIAAGAAPGAINLSVLDDPYNRRASVVPTVRFVNAVPGAAAFDIYVTKPGDPIGNPSAPNFAYQSFWPASGNDSQKLDDVNGKFRVRITAAGNPGTILFDSQEIDLDANADEVIAILPTQPASVALPGPFKRGDLKLRLDDGNQRNHASFDVVDHP